MLHNRWVYLHAAHQLSDSSSRYFRIEDEWPVGWFALCRWHFRIFLFCFTILMYLTLELAPGAARKYISNQTRNAILAPVWQKLARKTAAPGSRPKSLMDQMHWRREIHLPVKSNLPLLAASHLYQFWSLGLLVLPNTALRQNSEHKSEDINIPYSESKVFQSRFLDFYLQY